MSDFKTKNKIFWRIVKETLVQSIAPTMMYLVAGMVMLLFFAKNYSMSKMIAWSVVCGVLALAYDGLLTWLVGGTHYEQLVSGNMKRRSAMNSGRELNITSYKYEKEYRPWKGFAMGAFASGLAIIFGILFGIMQEKIDLSHTGEIQDKSVGLLVLLGFFLSGWSILPFYCANMWGMGASYWLSLLMAIIPIAVTGATYIWGAYGKRNKITREQEIADRAAKAQENKPKKINYGGLPGTKPKKRK